MTNKPYWTFKTYDEQSLKRFVNYKNCVKKGSLKTK